MTWGDRVTFEVSSASPDDTPVWVDLTPRVLAGGLELNTGRQNNLDASEPSSLRFSLRNDDDRFTFGNPSSPYASWWGPGRKCRLRETYGSTVLDLFTGYLQVPEESQPDAKAAGQFVNVTAIDRLGRLGAAPTFVSTLVAHIMGTQNLVLYYPLIDAGPNFLPSVGTSVLTAFRQVISSPAGGPIGDLVTYAGPPGPPGDDSRVASFAPAYVAGVGLYAYEFVSGTINLSVAAEQTFTMCAWMRPLTVDSVQSNAEIVTLNGPDFADFFDRPNSTGQSFITSGASSLTLTMPTAYPRDTWRLATLQITTVSGAVKLWVGTDIVLTGTMSGTPPSTLSFQILQIAQFYFGRLAHVQFYIGATPFSYADHLAQFAVGMTGLERQTTGDRIRTIAGYAGIPTAEYNDTVDKGTAIMQRATLAGKTPLEAMREAERTEQGLLYVDGSGRLVFKDRRSLYNV